MSYSFITRKRPTISTSMLVWMLLASMAVGGFTYIAITNSQQQQQETAATPQAVVSPALTNLLASHVGPVDILIYTTSFDYSALITKINDLGGIVTQQFKYVQGISATLPRAAVATLAQMAGVAKIERDSIQNPTAVTRDSVNSLDMAITDKPLSVASADMQALTLSDADVVAMATQLGPQNYANAMSMGALPLWDQGNYGQGSLVAVIDTGIQASHSMFGAGQVIGGVDLSTDVGTPYEGALLSTNHYHGTHCAGIIAGRGAYLFPTDSMLVQSMLYHGFAVPTYAADPSYSVVTLFGMAPLASLYAIKVFPHTGAGAPTSTIIAGIEAAISLKQSGTDVNVVSMSLGGGTGFDGRDMESTVVDYAETLGMTFSIAAGNEGPASQTVGSPGVATSAITVGAALTPQHTRVFWDVNYDWLGIGDYLFTPNENQMVYFSSRGTTADGRAKPDVAAVGVFVLSSLTGSDDALGFLSGTSMATPGVAGLVALLNTYGSTVGASPQDYKQAVIAGAVPMPGFPTWAQGAGLVNAANSMAALKADKSLGDAAPALKTGYSAQSVNPMGTFIGTQHSYTLNIQDLTPGHIEQLWFMGQPNLENIQIDFSNVHFAGPDPLGMNSFEFHLYTPLRSTGSYYFSSVNVYGDAHFSVSDLSSTVSGDVYGVYAYDLPLMPGNYKISIENDWTSYSNAYGTVTVTFTTGNNSAKADQSIKAKATTGSEDLYKVGFGSNGALIKLQWQHDWASYPTSDLDLIVAWFDTTGALHWDYTGATLNSPEEVLLSATNIASLYVFVDGYNTYGLTDSYILSIYYL